MNPFTKIQRDLTNQVQQHSMGSNANATWFNNPANTAAKQAKAKKAKTTSPCPERALPAPYSVEEFDKMWEQVALAEFSVTTNLLEKQKVIRSANAVLASELSNVQSTAQYGRLLPSATNVRATTSKNKNINTKLATNSFGLYQDLFVKILCLKPGDEFADIGHGIGSVAIQAAYTIGCKARGIELVPSRHLVAKTFLVKFEQQLQLREAAIDKKWSVQLRHWLCHEIGLPTNIVECKDSYNKAELFISNYTDAERTRMATSSTDVSDLPIWSAKYHTILKTLTHVAVLTYVHLQTYPLGVVELREGNLVDARHLNFLTSHVTAAFVNNFNSVFAERASYKCEPTLDFYVAGLFALMAPGARLATLHMLPLGLSRTQANAVRMNNGLCESKDASFYEVAVFNLGPANRCVSWSLGSTNTNMIKVYRYTRVEQSVLRSVFLCCNKGCSNARDTVPIDAVEIKSGRPFLLTGCNYCRWSPFTMRSALVQAKIEN